LHKIGSALSIRAHDILTMGKTILLGTTLAVIFAVFMIVPALAGGHLMITEAEVDDDEVEIEVAADIPTDGSLGDFGFGAFTTDGQVVVLTTHGGLGDDSATQEDGDDPAFHTHLITLTDAPDSCEEGFLEVTSITFEEVAAFEVDDDEVEIDDINVDVELNGDVVSFTLSTDEDELATCVTVVSFEAAGDDDDDDDD